MTRTRRFNPRGQCWGKRGYQSKARAKRIMKVQKRNPLSRAKSRQKLSVYLCPHCGLFPHRAYAQENRQRSAPA